MTAAVAAEADVFLSYYPLKQGLKLLTEFCTYCSIHIFILLSIKTRIETYILSICSFVRTDFYPTIH